MKKSSARSRYDVQPGEIIRVGIAPIRVGPVYVITPHESPGKKEERKDGSRFDGLFYLVHRYKAPANGTLLVNLSFTFPDGTDSGPWADPGLQPRYEIWLRGAGSSSFDISAARRRERAAGSTEVNRKYFFDVA